MSTEEFVIKIADLGYSRSLEIGETAMTGCGTPLQMAPEILFS
jgi:serine/threonine protein kinase